MVRIADEDFARLWSEDDSFSLFLEILSDDWVCPSCGAKKTNFEPDEPLMPGMVVPVGE